MSKMTNIGEHTKCPYCGKEARVVWVSKDRKIMAIKCTGYHSHDEHKAKSKKKYGKGMVFLTEATKKK